MPNYSLVANSTFQPFTYQELMAPIQRMSDYHEKLAEEYDRLSSQADVLEAMGKDDRDKNSRAYGQYKSYSDALRREADELYRFGLNTESRRRLSDLRRRYNQEIVPIQNAWAKRKEEADEQRKAQLQNPSLMFTRDAANTSIGDYVDNPMGGYGVINGANITAQMATMAKILEKQIREGDTTLEKIDPYTYNYVRRFGLDASMIRDWRNNPTLRSMYEQVMQANGVTPEVLQNSSNAQSIIDKSTGYAEMGMWSAIGEDKAQQIENYGARLNAQAAKELYTYREKKKIDGEELEDQGIPLSIAEERSGITTSNGYVPNAPEVLQELKAGNDGFKSSYFGRRLGSVDPMQIYREYQEERGKYKTPHTTFSNGTYGVVFDDDKEKARNAILAKYRHLGVTDILSDEQYNLLQDMGYGTTKRFSRHSDIMRDLDDLAIQHTRYSTSMSGYDVSGDNISNKLRVWSSDKGKIRGGVLWELDDKGKESPVTSTKDLELDKSTVTDIQYDPQHKTKLLVSFSNGQRRLVSPDVVDAKLTNALRTWETMGFDPRVITARLAKWLNEFNPQKSKTSSKAE